MTERDLHSKRKSIKTQVWQLIFIPSLVIILLISASLSLLTITQLNKYVDNRGQVLAEKTAHLLYNPLHTQNFSQAQEILDAIIEEPNVRAAHVYLSDSDRSLHAGPQLTATDDLGEPNLKTPLKRDTFRSYRFANPLVNSAGKDPQGWVEVELMSAPFLVLRYEALILVIALTILCLIIGAYFALSLYQNIVEPLNHIKGVVQQLARGKLSERISEQNTNEFFGLAESINTMAVSMELAQQDLQAHIDNAIEDLRETLETIEIQNVELDMARKEALEASRVKSEFLANTSHEIRTPLNGILGFVNLALKTDLSEQQQDYLETIRDSAQNLLTVINGILDFSKIESGKLTLDYAPLPIRKSIDEVLHMLAPDAHEKNLQLLAYIEPSIPKNLLGDALRFKQVLSNLVSNAIKYSDDGNIIVRVSIEQRQETQIFIKVAVSDKGIGLTQEEQEQLFNAFNQADNSSAREHEGTGLGLAICKGLVERMHGEIGVVSERDKGSTFWFTARLGIDKRQPTSSQLADLSDYRILLCGENADSIRQLDNLLREWHANTQQLAAVHDCFPALREAKGKSYDLLVLDIAPNERKIPPVLLNNLAQQLQQEFNCTLVVCCTPAHQRLFRAHTEQNSTLFINKPIAYESLLQSLGRQLDVHIKELRDQEAEDLLRPTAKVLLVDDNPANLQLAAELLRGLNTQVVAANNGKQAIEICANDGFDLIFMDIQMPGMDGIEATRQIRAAEGEQKRTPIIALTAHTITEQKSELLIAGMDDCISKPVSEAQLAHIINRWASLSGKKNVVVSTDENTPAPLRPTLPGELGSVDIQLCLKLANNKPALAQDMLSMLLESLETEKENINTAIASGEFTQAGELVHRLYGSCCYCGVPKLKHISGLLDKLFQAGDFDNARDALPALNHALDEVIRWGLDKDIHQIFDVEAPTTQSST